MKEIELTQGKVALVSDEDYEYLNQWKWCAAKHSKRYYAVRQIWVDPEIHGHRQRTIRMHRVIAERAGIDTSHEIDHKDRDGLNNQRDNLRPATHKQNNENRSVFRNNTSGCTGVSWDKRIEKWVARIAHDGKRIQLGRFNKKEDAIRARLEAEKKYWTHSEVSI